MKKAPKKTFMEHQSLSWQENNLRNRATAALAECKKREQQEGFITVRDEENRITRLVRKSKARKLGLIK